jgi:hypothetical protein
MVLPRYHYFGTKDFEAVKRGDQSVTELCLYDGQVLDLEFMRENHSVERLCVYNCEGVKSLDPLRNNTTITKLWLHGCSIESLEPLQHNASIRTLDIRDNLHPIDISPLSKTSIKTLCIKRCGMKSLASLQYNTSVVVLDLIDNHITDISPLRDNRAITKLDISENPIEDVSPIESMRSLEWFIAYNCKIRDADPIFRNQTIGFAGMNGNLIESIDLLRFNTSIDMLYISNNPIPKEHRLSALLSNAYVTDSSPDDDDYDLVGHLRLNRTNLPNRLLTLKNLSFHHIHIVKNALHNSQLLS